MISKPAHFEKIQSQKQMQWKELLVMKVPESGITNQLNTKAQF